MSLNETSDYRQVNFQSKQAPLVITTIPVTPSKELNSQLVWKNEVRRLRSELVEVTSKKNSLQKVAEAEASTRKMENQRLVELEHRFQQLSEQNSLLVAQNESLVNHVKRLELPTSQEANPKLAEGDPCVSAELDCLKLKISELQNAKCILEQNLSDKSSVLESSNQQILRNNVFFEEEMKNFRDVIARMEKQITLQEEQEKIVNERIEILEQEKEKNESLLKSQVRTLEARIQEMKTANSIAEENILSLNQALLAKENTIQDMEVRVEVLQSQVQQLTATNEQSQEHMRALTSQLPSISETNSKLASATVTNERLTAEKSKLENSLRILMVQKEHLELECKQTQHMMKICQAENTELLQAINELQEFGTQLQERMEDVTSELSHTRDLKEKLQEELMSSSVMYEEKCSQVSSLEQQVLSLQSELLSKDTLVTDLRSEISSLNRVNSELLESVEVMKQEGGQSLSSIKHELSVVEEKLAQKEQELEQVKQDHYVENVSLKSQLSAISEELNTTKTQLEKLQQCIVDQEKIMIQQKRVKELEEKLRDQTCQHDEQIAQVNIQRDNLVRELLSATQNSERLCIELERIKEEHKQEIESRVSEARCHWESTFLAPIEQKNEQLLKQLEEVSLEKKQLEHTSTELSKDTTNDEKMTKGKLLSHQININSREIERLKEIIKQRDTRIVSLKAEANRIGELRQANQSLKNQITAKEKELGTTQSTSKQLKSQLASLMAEVEHGKAAKAQFDDLYKENQQLQLRVTFLTKQTQQDREQIESLIHQVGNNSSTPLSESNKRDAFTKLKIDMNTLKRENTELKERLTMQQSNLSRTGRPLKSSVTPRTKNSE